MTITQSRKLNNIHFKIISILFLMFSLCSFAQTEVPILTEIVTDHARMFSNNEKQKLITKLTEFETETTNQIVVLTIPSLNNETIEEYALTVFEKNKLGQENNDNGVLILFSELDREVRIEVGYGLEHILTDAIASRIIRNNMIPNFKNGDYFDGIDEATSQIMKLINDPELVNEFVAEEEENDESGFNVTPFGRLFSSIILTPILFLLGVFGFNNTIARKNKDKKIGIRKTYKANPSKFLIILGLGMLIVGFFSEFFFKIFFFLIIIGIFSFLLFFTTMLLKEVYVRIVEIFKGLFTGKLGIIILPFYFPLTIVLFLFGFVFTLFPFVMAGSLIITVVNNTEINTLITNLEPIYFLFFFISCYTLLILACIPIAIYKIINSSKESFGFSFFNNQLKFSSNMFSGGSSSSGSSYSSSRSYSSSGSSSSSSSFSGGGGRSGGGGASGKW